MIYIDENENRIEEFDLNLGYLVDSEWIDHPAKPQIGHYEYEKKIIHEADKDNEEVFCLIQKFIVDQHASGAWKEVTVKKYIPYSDAELLHLEKLKYSERLDMLEQANINQNSINEEQAKTNHLLSAQVNAVSDRGDFIEDCIAEMATVVYA